MAGLVLEEKAQLVQRIRAGHEVAFASLVEAHLVPFSAGFDPTTSPSEPALPADRFLAADPVTWTGAALKKCASC